MRLLIVLIALFVGLGLYGSHRTRQAEARAAFVRDSVRRVDSLAQEAIRANMNRQAAAQLAAQQGMANLSAAQNANNAVRR